MSKAPSIYHPHIPDFLCHILMRCHISLNMRRNFHRNLSTDFPGILGHPFRSWDHRCFHLDHPHIPDLLCHIVEHAAQFSQRFAHGFPGHPWSSLPVMDPPLFTLGVLAPSLLSLLSSHPIAMHDRNKHIKNAMNLRMFFLPFRFMIFFLYFVLIFFVQPNCTYKMFISLKQAKNNPWGKK